MLIWIVYNLIILKSNEIIINKIEFINGTNDGFLIY